MWDIASNPVQKTRYIHKNLNWLEVPAHDAPNTLKDQKDPMTLLEKIVLGKHEDKP